MTLIQNFFSLENKYYVKLILEKYFSLVEDICNTNNRSNIIYYILIIQKIISLILIFILLNNKISNLLKYNI